MTTAILRRAVILGVALSFGCALTAVAEEKKEEKKDEKKDAKKGEGGEGKGGTLVEGQPGGPWFYPLPDILVNIDAGGPRPVYLKVKVALQIAKAEDGANLEAFKPRILDDLLLYLRELRLENLKNPKVIDRLRQELLMRIKLAVKPIKVNDILFREFLVQ